MKITHDDIQKQRDALLTLITSTDATTVETIIDKIWLPYIIDFIEDFRIEIKPMGYPWEQKVRILIDKSNWV